MDTKEIIGIGSMSIINNPFLPSCIESITIRALKNLFNPNEMHFTRRVDFTNGNTEGSQKFKGENLADVFNQIMIFCINLK